LYSTCINKTKAWIYRDESSGEVASQQLFLPGLLLKVPGRFYVLSVWEAHRNKGKEEILKDKEVATQFYAQVKSEVESNIACSFT
jgi:hypothetical protein